MRNKTNIPRMVFKRHGDKYCPEKEKLKKDLAELFSIIQDANSAHEIWWTLINKDDRKKYLETYLYFKEFFEPVAKANLVAMSISLFKLYDGTGNSLGFPKLLKSAEKLKLVNTSANKKLKRKISESTRIWKKICILRHNLLAHRNYSLTRTEIYRLANITPNQIKRLIDLSLKIFNTLWMKIETQPMKIDDITSKHTLEILEALKK
jgi:AbiU2